MDTIRFVVFVVVVALCTALRCESQPKPTTPRQEFVHAARVDAVYVPIECGAFASVAGSGMTYYHAQRYGPYDFPGVTSLDRAVPLMLWPAARKTCRCGPVCDCDGSDCQNCGCCGR